MSCAGAARAAGTSTSERRKTRVGAGGYWCLTSVRCRCAVLVDPATVTRLVVCERMIFRPAARCGCRGLVSGGE